MPSALNKHFVTKKVLKDACNFYREGSGGWWAYSTALKNVLASGAIKQTAKTRKGGKAYCPASCTVHAAITGQ